MEISLENLKKILDSFSQKKIIVIGDLMLDHYIFGDVSRISPEAPVPVVNASGEKHCLGGAANVSNNIKSLSATPLTIGTIGQDANGTIVKTLFAESRISTEGIFLAANKPTIKKTRIVARNQHLLRIDFENPKYNHHEIEKEILNYIKKIISTVDGVILQDYNKGFLSKNLIKKIIKLANENDVIISVDPKNTNFFEYKNISLFKPNKIEVEKSFGHEIQNDKDLITAAEKLIKKLNARYLLITLGKDGMFIYNQSGEYWTIPTFSQEVYDVSGAGDTVISTLTLALCSGCDIRTASIIANHAAGVVCGKIGAASVTTEEIINSFHNWKHIEES
ncbi:MAG: D-glycero-beta-D-manno-heptose-7-phosphate kinase [Candidatus Cloacimonadota bacterium]|nr:D-glycero-beta-D-manno-heptose-7-phosphate kinase [Candidatus Cloacimonadota bacterium]